jgi:acyl-CoA thioester hydrolase
VYTAKKQHRATSMNQWRGPPSNLLAHRLWQTHAGSPVVAWRNLLIWDLPAPHAISITVSAAEIDAYDHVNNSVYMTWFERAAWDHSAAVGLPLEQCLELDYGMVVLRSVIAYLRPAVRGDAVRVATWILPNQRKVRVSRRFQVLRDSDSSTLARAEIEYACVELSTGRPARWPPVFLERYIVIDEVANAYPALTPV